jgi:hypothetical protein
MKKFSSLLVVLLLMLASFTAGVEYQRGDVSQDGQVNITDVTCLIDYLLTGVWPDEPVTPPEEHEWVDLGLPSGTLWATCYVGANSPEEFGDYFAWGETEPKEVYDWASYKWCNGSASTMTKYCINSEFGYNGITDGKTELDPEDDAAYVNWGEGWRMPTKEQLQELLENCTWRWTQQNGVNGFLATGPNGNTIFFSAAGARSDKTILDPGSYGDFWSRTLSSHTCYAYDLAFNSESVSRYSGDRSFGRSIRAVRVSQE